MNDLQANAERIPWEHLQRLSHEINEETIRNIKYQHPSIKREQPLEGIEIGEKCKVNAVYVLMSFSVLSDGSFSKQSLTMSLTDVDYYEAKIKTISY